MKAPDKVYLWDVEIEQRNFAQESELRNIPYIRKDALLEWAKECTDSFNEHMEKLKPTDIAYRVLSGGVSTIELLLNKINSL